MKWRIENNRENKIKRFYKKINKNHKLVAKIKMKEMQSDMKLEVLLKKSYRNTMDF